MRKVNTLRDHHIVEKKKTKSDYDIDYARYSTKVEYIFTIFEYGKGR